MEGSVKDHNVRAQAIRTGFRGTLCCQLKGNFDAGSSGEVTMANGLMSFFRSQNFNLHLEARSLHPPCSMRFGRIMTVAPETTSR